MRPWFRRRLTAFRHVNGRGLSPIAHLPDPYLTRSSRAFPHTFSTTVFSQCTCGRFEAFPRRAAPEGQTTSIASTAPHSAEPPSTNPSCLLRSRSQHHSYSTAVSGTTINPDPPPAFVFTTSPCRFIPALPIDQNGLPDCVLPIRAPVPDQPNLRPTPDRARQGVSCLEKQQRTGPSISERWQPLSFDRRSTGTKIAGTSPGSGVPEGRTYSHLLQRLVQPEVALGTSRPQCHEHEVGRLRDEPMLLARIPALSLERRIQRSRRP